MSDDKHYQAILDVAFDRLRKSLRSRDVSAPSVKKAALDALNQAREKVARDPKMLAELLDRLKREGQD